MGGGWAWKWGQEKGVGWMYVVMKANSKIEAYQFYSFGHMRIVGKRFDIK